MRKPASAEQKAILGKIMANGGEALKDGTYYRAGGWTVCHTIMMDVMARKGLVRLERVGDSTFAIPVVPA